MTELHPASDPATGPSAPAAPEPRAASGNRRSPLAMAARRFRRNKAAVVALAVLLVVVLAALAAPLITPHSPTAIDLDAVRQPPSAEHWLGTDATGRDVFTRLIFASRVSLLVGILAAGLAVLVGAIIGAVAGLFGGWVDSVLMRAADVVLSFPSVVVIIVIAGILGAGVPILIFAIAATTWPTPSRIVRGVTLATREQEYLHASRIAGGSRLWLLRKHLVPAAMGQIVVVGTLAVAGAILTEAVLSFLGLGVQPPRASWGNMLNEARSLTVISSMPWLWLPPGVAIALTVLAVNFVGDGLRDAVEPRQSGRS